MHSFVPDTDDQLNNCQYVSPSRPKFNFHTTASFSHRSKIDILQKKKKKAISVPIPVSNHPFLQAGKQNIKKIDKWIKIKIKVGKKNKCVERRKPKKNEPCVVLNIARPKCINKVKT